MYMPPNVTALIQPMDQNIIRLTKLHYRNQLLSTIVAKSDQTVTDTLKQFTLKDATILLAQSWAKIAASSIVKCWKNILNDTSEMGFDEEDNIPLSIWKTLPESQIQDERSYITEENLILLNNITKGNPCVAADIADWNSDNVDDVSDSDDSSSDEVEIIDETEKAIDHSEATNALNKTIEWAQQNNVSLQDLNTLQNLRHKAVVSNVKVLKQTSINNYFSKN